MLCGIRHSVSIIFQYIVNCELGERDTLTDGKRIFCYESFASDKIKILKSILYIVTVTI